MIRSGFTLLEMVIVVTIIAMISTVSFTTFESSRGRILYQNAISQIEEGLNQAKTIAYNTKDFGQIQISDEVEPEPAEDGGVVAWFDINNDRLENFKVYSTKDLNSVEYDSNNDLEIKNVDFSQSNNPLIVDEFKFKDYSAADLPENIKTFNEDLYIIFSKSACVFSDGNEQINQLMLQVPLKYEDNKDLRTLRYLYLHSTACIPEILIDNLF